MNNVSGIPHQYENVAFTGSDADVRIPTGRETAINIPSDPHESTNIATDTQGTTIIPMDPEGTLAVPLDSQETTSIPIDPEEATTIPIDPEEITTIPIDPEETTTIPTGSDGTTTILSDSQETPSRTSNRDSDASVEIETPNIPLDPQGTENRPPYPAQSISIPLQPLGTRRNHLPSNLTPVNPMLIKDTDVPPPPYWSIDSANDILASPTIPSQQTTNNLTTAPPPAYNTLYNFETPERPQGTGAEQNQNESRSEQPEPKHSRLIWLYSLIFGMVIPVFMTILKHAVECPAKHSITDSLIPGIVFHILHGLTTILTGGKLLCPNKAHNYDFFILLIFGWTIAVSSMVYKLDRDADCDQTLYWFLLCLLTFYNIVFGCLFLYLIRPLLIRIKFRLKTMFT